jgi:hypothetical protein
MILILRESCDSLPTDLQCRDTIRDTLDGFWKEFVKAASEVFESRAFERILDVSDDMIDRIHR